MIFGAGGVGHPISETSKAPASIPQPIPGTPRAPANVPRPIPGTPNAPVNIPRPISRTPSVPANIRHPISRLGIALRDVPHPISLAVTVLVDSRHPLSHPSITLFSRAEREKSPAKSLRDDAGSRFRPVAQASRLWGQRASCPVGRRSVQQAGRLLAPQAGCLCYGPRTSCTVFKAQKKRTQPLLITHPSLAATLPLPPCTSASSRDPLSHPLCAFALWRDTFPLPFAPLRALA